MPHGRDQHRGKPTPDHEGGVLVRVPPGQVAAVVDAERVAASALVIHQLHDI